MMFSKSCEYAIKAVIHLCMETKDGKRLSIAEIAEAIDTPTIHSKNFTNTCQA